MKTAPLKKRTAGAPTRPPQKFIQSLFQAASPLIVLSLTLILTGIAWYFTQQSIENSGRAWFEKRVLKASEEIQERIQAYIETLLSARGLFAVNENITRADWKKYFESLDLQKRYPGFYDFDFSRYVPRSERAEFEKRVRGDRSLDQKGYPDFSIYPDGDRSDYYPIEYSEPFSPIPKQFGFDIGSDPLRRDSIEQARDTGRPVSTGRIILVNSEEVGFAIRVPVYRNGLPQATIEERRRALIGFIVAAFKMQDLMQGVFGKNVPHDFDFEIFDGGTEKTADPLPFLTAERLLYDNDQILHANRPNHSSRYSQIFSLEIAGRIWHIYFSDDPRFKLAGERELPPFILLSGITISLLLSYITWSATTARRRAVDLAEAMTADLWESEERFRAIFDRAPSGIGVVDLDGKFVQVNQGLAELLGYTQEELRGLTFQEVTHPDDLTKSLAHKENFLAGKVDKYRFEKRYIRKDGRIVWADLIVSQIHDPSNQSKYFVTTVDDITDRKEADEKLRRSEAQLSKAQEIAHLGSWSLDLTSRSISWSDELYRIYGLTPQSIALTYEIVFGYTHPEDRDRVSRTLSESTRGLQSFGFDFRIIRADGSIRVIHVEGEVLSDATGRAVRMFGTAQDITERKEAEEALRETNQMLQALIEASPLAIIALDLDGNVAMWNPAAEQIFGWRAEEVIGRFNPIIPHGGKNEFKTISGSVLEGKAFSNLEVRRQRKDGSQVDLSLSTAPLRDAKGDIRGVMGILADMTAHKLAEEGLRKSEARFRRLAESNLLGIGFWNGSGEITEANEAFLKMVGYTHEDLRSGRVRWRDMTPEEHLHLDEKALVEIAERGVCTPFEKEYIRKDGSRIPILIGRASLEGQADRGISFVLDMTERLRAERALRQSEEQYRLLFDRNPHSMWVVDPSTHAFLAVNEAAVRHYGYSREAFLQMTICDIRPPEEVPRLLGYLKEAVRRAASSDPTRGGVWMHIKRDGTLIEVEITWNLILFRGKEARLVLAEDVTETRKTERELQASERRFRQLAENIHEVFWMFTPHPPRILYISPAYEKIWGRTCQSLYDVPLSFLEAVHPDDRGDLLAAMERQQNGEHTEISYRVVRPDGSIRWVRDRAFPIREASGEIYRIVGVAEDITERRETEEALRNSETRNRALLDAIPDMMFRIGRDGTFLDFRTSKALQPILPPSRFLGKKLDEVMPADFARRARFYIERALTSGEMQLFEYVLGVGEEIRDYEARIMVSGENEVLSIVRDITEKNKGEEALRKSEERFQLATRATNDAIWDWDLITNALWWNEGFKTMFGYTGEEIKPQVEWWADRIHPEDREGLLASVQGAIEGGDQFWSGEYRFRRGDGTDAVVFDRGYIVHDQNGKPVRMIGAMMDITERKQAEEALRIKTDQLGAVTDAMTAYLDSRDWHESSARLLRSALQQTQSEYGFIGVVVEGPAFRILAIEGIDLGSVKSRPFYTKALRMDRTQEYLELHSFDNLFGKVIRSGKVILSNDAAADPRSGGLPPGHPPMRTFLGVPIIRQNEVVGMIGIANRPAGYTGAEQAGLEILSHAAGILYDNYRRREREILLEDQRRNVEKELRHSQEQLRNLSGRFNAIVEEERTRISREIHDELGQLLTILKMELSWLKKRLPKKEAILRERTKSMAKLVDTTVQTLRKISTELRPGVLDDLGLTAAIEWQVQEFQSRTKLRCSLAVRPEEILLDPDRSTAVFRIFQETLTNIVRHADADKVEIRLEKQEDCLILEVKDNGKGITQSQITNSKSLGLLGIRERALLWGGTVQISGIPGKGTTVTVQIPLHQTSDNGKPA